MELKDLYLVLPFTIIALYFVMWFLISVTIGDKGKGAKWATLAIPAGILFSAFMYWIDKE